MLSPTKQRVLALWRFIQHHAAGLAVVISLSALVTTCYQNQENEKDIARIAVDIVKMQQKADVDLAYNLRAGTVALKIRNNITDLKKANADVYRACETKQSSEKLDSLGAVRYSKIYDLLHAYGERGALKLMVNDELYGEIQCFLMASDHLNDLFNDGKKCEPLNYSDIPVCKKYADKYSQFCAKNIELSNYANNFIEWVVCINDKYNQYLKDKNIPLADLNETSYAANFGNLTESERMMIALTYQ